MQSKAYLATPQAMKPALRVVISGGAGYIAYSLVCELAKGWVFGPDQPVTIVLLEVPQAEKFADGVKMELIDCAFPLLQKVEISSDGMTAFKDCDYAILLGAFPRGPGMERADLLSKNKGIFEEQGKALQAVGKSTCRVLVVGNPANTNALVLSHYAPKLKHNITAMSRLDHNRCIGQIALKFNTLPVNVKNAFILGNHSNTMVPILDNVEVNGKKVYSELDQAYLKEFDALIRGRGAAVIAARGKSSAMSAANAALTHVSNWHLGTKSGEVVSVSLLTEKDNIYGIPEGIFFSFPCIQNNGNWQVIQMTVGDHHKEDIQKSIDELLQERKMALNI